MRRASASSISSTTTPTSRKSARPSPDNRCQGPYPIKEYLRGRTPFHSGATIARLRRKMPTGKRSRPGSPPTAARKDDGRQLGRLRRHCLSIPGAIEKLSHGEPTFFTPKRVFAMFANNHHNDGHVAVWLPAGSGVQEALIEEAPQIYFRPPYVGSAGWIGVEMSKVDDDQLGSLVLEAFYLIVAKVRGAGPRKSSKRRAARKRT